MKQRAALARALIAEPRYLLMDEPFASLDAQTREFMQIELMKIWQQHKGIVVFVTHSVDEAVMLSDQIVLLRPRPGQVAEVLDVEPAASALGIRRARAAGIRRSAPLSLGADQGDGRRRSAIGILYARDQAVERRDGRRHVTAQIARGRNGVVAAGHGLASEAAITVLRAGGNAVDASIAAALVLAVVCPYAVSLAGDLYALVYEPKSGTVAGLNATGAAPAAATRERFADGIPGTGILSATVPGMLRGLDDLAAASARCRSRRCCRRRCASLKKAFPFIASLRRIRADRAELLAKNAAARALFLPGGKPLEEHTHFRQPDLAAVLRAIAGDGVEGFYRGEIARLMVQAAQAAGGLFSAEDFAAHRSLWQEPIAAPFYGHDVLTMPPNSFGATLLWQLLALEAGKIDRVDPESADFVLQGYDARRSAYRAVARLIADPRQTEAKLRRALIEAVSGDAPRAAQPEPAEARDRCTTCVTVIDRGGMAVSLIESVSAPYGAGVVLDGTGILLNNRMAGFNTDAEQRQLRRARQASGEHARAVPCDERRQAGDERRHAGHGRPDLHPGAIPRPGAGLRRRCRRRRRASPRWSVDFQGKLVVEDTMAPALREAVQARAPEARAMREGWISFGSIKLAANTPDGLLGIADHRRVAQACRHGE